MKTCSFILAFSYLMLFAGPSVASQGSTETTNWFVGTVRWAEPYGDGRIRFALDGISNACVSSSLTTEDGSPLPVSAFEMRADQPGVKNVIAAVLAAFLSDGKIKAFMSTTAEHYQIGCKIYKATLLR